MIEMLKSEPGLIAARFAGSLGREETDKLMDQVEASLAAQDKTHLYIEVEGLPMVALEALPSYIPRALALLGKLGRFGRIAVVSDRPWVRLATRIESALLPGVSYETFEPGERAQAMAWVEGKRPKAR